MNIPCPACDASVSPDEVDSCPKCGCEIEPLGRILLAAEDSLTLALESLRERRERDALDYAYEAWGLKKTYETAAIGLLAAMTLRDGPETMRWLRRRQLMREQDV